MSFQTSVDKSTRSLDRRKLALGAVIGVVGILCCVSAIAVMAFGVIVGPRAIENADTRTRTPSASLNVAADGCTVIRSEVESSDPVRALQWVITNESGRQVLARNALGENRYTYFRPGKYDVVLKSYHIDRYVDVSQHVKIVCP